MYIVYHEDFIFCCEEILIISFTVLKECRNKRKKNITYTCEALEGTANHRQLVAHTWEQVLEGSDIEPIDIHTPLWLWSRAGFPDSH
ncbi:hypothetical protein [Bacillus manliponensis]|uniref:hypothetical protein n=1 Tax=Bacillus manliponensis TaxID=574376 RepID=UPI0035150708